jgi:molybdopterin synthase catalytic subunit
MTDLFAVRSTPLRVEEALAAVEADEVGGVVVFVGTVRNHNDGRPVTLLEYHAYESMAERQMRRIGEEIAREIVGVRLAALHRVGALAIGDAAVVCVAAAPHRGEAFRACRLLIDRIKADVPIWKREHGPEGPYWVGWEDARCQGHKKHGDEGHGHGHGHGQAADGGGHGHGV